MTKHGEQAFGGGYIGGDIFTDLMADLVHEDIVRTTDVDRPAELAPARIDPLVAYRLKVHKELGGTMLGDLL